MPLIMEARRFFDRNNQKKKKNEKFFTMTQRLYVSMRLKYMRKNIS